MPKKKNVPKIVELKREPDRPSPRLVALAQSIAREASDGEIQALATVSLTPDGRIALAWGWSDVAPNLYALVGGLDALQHELLSEFHESFVPNTDEEF